jgi:subtilase family serine protease
MRATQIGFDPSEIGLEGNATIYATVINEGGAAVGEVVVHILDVTDGGSTPIGDPQTISDLGPGASDMVQVSYTVPPGSSDRRIQVVVDPNNTIFESSESDNQATATLARSKSALANLMITTDNVTFAPTMPLVGDEVTLRAVVLNNGATDANDVMVQFTDVTDGGSTPIGPQQTLPLIPAGGSAVIEMSYTATEQAGSRSIRVAVDPSNFIAEGRETDNTATVTLEIHPSDRPNLVVLASNINFSPLTVSANDTVMVRAVILNHGAREARDVVVQFMDVSGGSQVPIGSPQSLARIAPGNAAIATMSFTPPAAGDYTIQVVADPNNFIVESDELDNLATKSLIVGAPPAANLVALSSNIEFVPSMPQDGNLVTIHATVLNNGTSPATDVVVRIEDVTDSASPQLIGKQRLIDSLQPGEEATVQVVYDTTDKAGDRTIRMVVDPLDAIAESDESDNEAITVLTVAPPPAPNLVVDEDNIRFSPLTPSDGQVVTITVTVLNDGQRNANRVEVQLYDNTNGTPVPIGDIQIIGGISAGSSGMAQVPYDTTGKEGERTIQVVVDPANLIAETNEEDNQAEATLTVGPPSDDPSVVPNLVMTSSSVVFTPTQPAPGDVVTLTIRVRNDGAVDASGVVVRVMDVTETPEQVGDDVTIPSIPAGETMTATLSYDTTDKTGSRSLTVSADPDNTITESNENDNTATVTIPLGNGETPPGEPGEGDEPPAEPGEPGEPPAEPGEPDEPEDGDEDANVDNLSSREEPLDPSLNVELAEDLNLRD